MRQLRQLLRLALDAVFPPRCVACWRAGAFLCQRCIAGMRPNLVPPGEGEIGPLTGIWAPYRYEGAARSAVIGLKFRGFSAAAEEMGRLLAEFARGQALAADVIVPVPLHRRRRRSRGYDQAALVARSLGAQLGIPVRAGAVRRARPTRPQTAMHDAVQRQANIAGAFAPAGECLPPETRVLLVDDVATTGATLAACATALVEAGAVAVTGLAFAREQ